MILWALACSGEGAQGVSGLDAAAFAGPEAFRMEFVEADLDTGATSETLHLRAEDGTWTFRVGERWSEATELGEIEVTVDGTLALDGQVVLPSRVSPGATDEGVEVTALGELEVHYGTFPSVASVTVSDGVPGDHAFAQDVGPVRLELFDGRWQLAYYE